MLPYNDYLQIVLDIGKFIITDDRIQERVSVRISFARSGMAPVGWLRLTTMHSEHPIQSDIEVWEGDGANILLFASAFELEDSNKEILEFQKFECIDIDAAKVVIEKIIELYE